jgi:hypothetical protein
MHGADTHKAIETVWRLESPRLIAALIRVVRASRLMARSGA